MSTTLIARDATLAINGAPEQRGEPAEYLEIRIDEVRGFDVDFIRDCMETLAASAKGSSSDPEVLRAVLILAIAHPALAAEMSFSPITCGRQLAAHEEQEGVPEQAIAILELLVQLYPGHKVLERDLAGAMRRQGKAQILVERYLERAEKLLKQGRTPEAIAWMRQVLLLDRSRKDVARRIRDLRYEEIDRQKGRSSRLKGVLVVMLVLSLVGLGVVREQRLWESFAMLPPATGDLESLRVRLDNLERFMEAHPLWHKTLALVDERKALLDEIERREDEIRLERERQEAKRIRRREDAELAHQRGVRHAESGEYEAALEELSLALELADEDWETEVWVERDVAAIEAYLEERE